MDLAVRGGLVVTQDASRRILRADVGVEDGRIVAVGDVPGAADEIDASGALVVPGLVNLHTHAAMTLFRGYADDLPLETWLRDRIWPAEAKLDRAAVRAGTRLALAEMVAGGTTAYNDMYFFPDDSAREAEDAGVRAFLGVPMLDFATPEMPPEEMPKRADAFLSRWKGHSLVTPTVLLHAAYTASPPTVEAAAGLAESHGALVHAHLHETRHEVYEVAAARGLRPIEYLAHHRFLRRGVFAHGGWLTKSELGRVAEVGAAIAHCPVSNWKLGTGGTLALPELWEAGGVAGLGTDGPASNNGLDLFETMKLAALGQKQHRWDPTAAPAARVLDMATRDGARALGLDAGRIEPGALADLVVVDATKPHMAPMHDPVSQLVYAARASDVRATIVAGVVVYADGVHRTLDVERAIAEARRAAERVTSV